LAKEGFLGAVVAPATVDVNAEIDGHVVGIEVRAGDRVRAGAVLAHVSSPAASEEVQMAYAQLLAARTDHDRALLELEQARAQEARRAATVQLSSGSVVGVASTEEREGARQREKLARLQVRARQAQVLEKTAHWQQLKRLARQQEVLAPFDGVVARRYVDVGAVLRKGMPIARIVQTSRPRLRFAVPEDEARPIAVGSSLRVALQEADAEARVTHVAPEIDPATRMILVEAELELSTDRAERVRPGEAARVMLLQSAQAR
jgi:RND family efflux transporter MFP subunit